MTSMLGTDLKVKQVRTIADDWMLKNLNGESKMLLSGLPEYDDRYDLWRVPIVAKNNRHDLIGELKINEKRIVVENTKLSIIRSRAKKKMKANIPAKKSTGKFYPYHVDNSVIYGNACKDT